MLTSLVIQFTPSESINLPRDLGRASHALLLRLLSAENAPLAKELHASDDAKPFTCSNVQGGKHHEGSLIAAPGDTLWVRYTGLTAPVSQLLTVIPSHLPAESIVEIDGVQFKVTSTTIDSSINPRAGSISYALLSAPYLMAREMPATRIMFKFVAPTAFKSHGQNVPLPLPGSVFGSLLDKWNSFAPITMPDEVRRFADECLAVSQYVGRTRALRGKEGNVQIGFVGTVRFTATNRDRYWLSLINVLADFAWYAGVGRLATQGMGQVRRILDAAE